MITPDDLAARFAPPLPGGGELYRRQLTVTDSAYQLAEQLLTALPAGHHLDQAVIALESAAHWACAGLAALDQDTAIEATCADEPVPLLLSDAPASTSPLPRRPVPAAPPLAALAAVPVTDLSGIGAFTDLWRTGLRGALDLAPLPRLVAYTLASYAGADGGIAAVDQPSIRDLCEACGTDSTCVLHALQELAETGWITRRDDGTGATSYQLRMPTSPAATA